MFRIDRKWGESDFDLVIALVEQRYAAYRKDRRHIRRFIRHHLIIVWQLIFQLRRRSNMFSPLAKSAMAARPPDQKEHACEIDDLEEQRTSQRRDDYCADGMRSKIDSQSVAAQDHPKSAIKDFEGQRRSPGFSPHHAATLSAARCVWQFFGQTREHAPQPTQRPA